MSINTLRPPGARAITDDSGSSPAKASAAPEGRHQVGLDRRSAGGNIVLNAWKPKDPAIALGLAVEFLRKKPAFARLQFGEWSQVLSGQIKRGHYFFVVDQNGRIHGFLGWALTQEHLAEQWIEGRSGLRNDECREGDCVIVNAWAADTHHATRCILDACRALFVGKRAVYFKRHYPDGRARPMRLAVNDFVSRHVARRRATRVRSSSE